MKELSYNNFLGLLEVHQPVRIKDEDINRVREWYDYYRSIYEITMRRIETPEEIRNVRENLKKVLSKYSHLTLYDICEKMSPSQMRQLQEDEKEREQLEFEKIASQYIGIESRDTGGYVSNSWSRVPPDFEKLLIQRAAGTRMEIIKENRYRSHDDHNSMIDELIDNACEHGNRFSTSKNVYLLWHKCNKGKEVHIIDEGEVDRL